MKRLTTMVVLIILLGTSSMITFYPDYNVMEVSLVVGDKKFPGIDAGKSNLNRNGEKIDAHIVKTHQKISDIEGGFNGTLDNQDYFGRSVSQIGDLDGDGITDIAACAYWDDDGGTNKGAVWILFMNRNGTVKSHQKISDTEGNFTGTLDIGDYWGESVTELGDLNGDGVLDIAVSAARDDDGGFNKGAVWILFLNINGTVKSHQKISDTEGGFTGTLDNEDFFGSSVSKIGDLDGDNITDIAVGAYFDDDEDFNVGAVWILFLNSNGTVKSHQKISQTEGGFNRGWMNGDLNALDWFGSSVSDIGDLNEDGILDIVVGVMRNDLFGIAAGHIWILFLNTDGTVKSHKKIPNFGEDLANELKAGDQFGCSVSDIGDLNGDGAIDILVGAFEDDDGGNDRGTVYVLFMNKDGTVKSHQKISDTGGNFKGILDNSDKFGTSVSGVGDLDGDGTLDIIVSAFEDDDGGQDRGCFWTFFLHDKPSFGTLWNSTLTTGDTERFSANVTDIIGGGLNEVWFNFTIDNDTALNWSVTNHTGNSWWVEMDIPNNATSFDYFFWVNNTDDVWAKTDKKTLKIFDNDEPSFGTLWQNELTTGDEEMFSVNVTDNMGVHSVLFDFKINGRSYKNWSVTNRTQDSWDITIVLPSNATIIEYRFRANDSSDNWGKVGNITRDVIDNDKPVFGKLWHNELTTGDVEMFSANITDNIDIHTVIFDFKINGTSHYNWTVTNNTENSWEISILIPFNALNFEYRFWANDSADNWGKTDNNTHIVIDNDKMMFGTLWHSPLTTGDPAVFSINVSDNIGLNEVWFNYILIDVEYNDHTFNLLVTNHTDVLSWKITIMIPPDATYIVYHFRATDMSDNGNETPIEASSILDNDLPVLGEDRSGEIPSTGDSYTFSLTVRDNIELANVSVWYKFDNESPFNVSMHNEGGLWIKTIDVPAKAFNLTYCFYIEDNTGNCLVVNKSMKKIHDNDLPRLQEDLITGIATTGEVFVFSIGALDNIKIDSVFVRYSFDVGMDFNQTMFSTDLENWSLSILVPTNATYLEYSFFINDTSENFIITEMQNRTVIDNDDPIALAGEDITIDQHENTLFNGTFSSDNVAIINYTWSFFYNGEKLIYYGSEVPITFDSAGENNVTLKIIDEAGNSDTDYLIVTVRDITPPVAEAGDDFVIDQGQLVNFNGSGSYDNVLLVNYTWTIIFGNVTQRFSGLTPSFTFDKPGMYHIKLNITDSAGNWHSDHLNVTVRDSTPPVAQAGEDITIEEGDTVVLNGTGSKDNVGILTYTWRFIYDGAEKELNGPLANFSFLIPGNYTIILTVEDAMSNIGTDVVKVQVESTVIIIPDDTPVEKESSFPIWGVILIGLIVILIIIFLVVLIRLRNKKEEAVTEEKAKESNVSIPDEETPIARLDEPVDVTVKTEELNHSSDQSTINESVPPVVSSDIASPICPTCGQFSVYYQEYECFWCDGCQDYVSSEEENPGEINYEPRPPSEESPKEEIPSITIESDPSSPMPNEPEEIVPVSEILESSENSVID